ncbi:MAG TPA: hypothetical protein VK508_17800 [Cyclobacteriaceae bacterium]|nr:hypothetical protein [Cyclobacteriaceae bacterium]
MKMATIVLLMWASVCMAQTPSQYHVVRVVGAVESPALKRQLKTGDVIQSKDQLKFGNKESYIIVNSPQTGRKRISGVPDSSPREFLQLLQSFVQPELKSTASRSISLQYLETLQNSMAFDTLLILGNGFIPVNTEKLSLVSPAIIRAWHYDVQRKIHYTKISGATGFSLNGPSLFGEGDFTTRKVVVEYFEDEKEDPVFSPGMLLGAFVPMYISEEGLAFEIRALISTSDKTKPKAVLTEINAYLRDEYAPAQEDNLKAWLKEQKILD